MKFIITFLFALLLILTIVNKVISYFRPRKTIDTRWILKGLFFSGVLLAGSLIHLYVNWAQNPPRTGVMAALLLFVIFADQYRIQRAVNAANRRG
jgi:hypothetical protein